MFTALASTSTLNSEFLTQISRDTSAFPAWFVAPSGMASYLQVVEYSAAESFEVKPLPIPMNVFQPKTKLAKRLWEIRLRSIAAGENEASLDWDGVRKEMADRRGEGD